MVRTDALFARWEERVGDLRADATARRILGLLGGYPVVSSDRVAGRLNVSERAARAALGVLADRSILAPHEVAASRSGRPRHYWVARDLLGIIAGWPGN
jgi:predicted ArsR family transcriptional regulator